MIDKRDPASQDEVFAFLANPATHGLKTGVKRIDTHGAAVFLAGEDVYKLKKNIRFPFMDFSTLEKRRAVCAREIAVNKANAPQLYLAALPITRTPQGKLKIGGDARDAIEWAVHLRRFDENATLDCLAWQGELDLALIEKLAKVIAAAHEVAAPAAKPATVLFRDQLESTLDDLAAADDIFDASRVAAFQVDIRAELVCVEPLLREREKQGQARRCHGDLHLRNIVLIAGEPVLFDAIEFDDDFATCDKFYDLAFLLMDLWQRGLHAQANLLLNRYLAASREDVLCLDGLAALPLFLSSRAAIRDKVAAAQAREDAKARHRLVADARGYFDAACGFLQKEDVRLVAIGGFSGTGKSTLAQRLASHIGRAPGAIHLRSDSLRKKMHGLPEFESLKPEAYRSEVSTKVYAELRLRSEHGLRTGQSMIIDASFLNAGERDLAEELGRRSKAAFTGIWLDADREILLRRVAARKGDVSDAGPAVVIGQIEKGAGHVNWPRLDAARPLDELVHAAQALIER